MLEGVQLLWDWRDEALPLAGRWLAVAAFGLTLLVLVLRRRIDFLALGALASGALALTLAGQSGVVATRYYIPSYALFAVAFALSLARLPTPFQVAGLAAVSLAFTPFVPIQEEVRRWVDGEQREGAVIRAVGEQRGCTIATAGLDLERVFALPVLIALEQRGRETGGACERGPTYMLVGNVEAARPLLRACDRGALTLVRSSEPFLSLFRCGRLRDERVRDPEIGTVDPEELVAVRRLRPSLDG
jgi:hypothetical protein